MESSSQDRNLPASQRKLNKAKDDGQVARSRDLSHLAVLGGGAVAVMVLAPVLFEQLKLGLSQQLSFDSKSILQTGSMLGRLQDMTLTGLIGCGVFAAIVMAASILSAIGSGGWVASLKPVMPDFSRLNPISGFGRMFTKEKFSEVAKMTFVMAVLILLGAMYFSTNLQAIASLTLQPSQAAIQALNEWLKKGMGVLLLVIFVVAVVDVQLQNFLHKSRLKMSHQEVKQEQKESEGSPQLKGRMRQRQREISHGNSISAVVRADFVVMNPTHFAVAIRYDEKTMRAPQVISKGADLLAMKIRDIAKTNSIPVLQSPILARALYANAELDQDIPSSLYTAVAQVLAYVYRLKSALRGDGPMPGEQPDPFVPPELDPLSSQVSNQNQP
ncbi:MAG TPA: EscU/YscU/HrcU family type III secretion system export apparatus switch protein [Burkholderiaceae bacterium]|jgi:flagellar biosynthesis protein FlhB|nr:EscU/YscU/HrcU family type III secretion system export apparatus switch protein [Burkholderiaceae bacterium]